MNRSKHVRYSILLVALLLVIATAARAQPRGGHQGEFGSPPHFGMALLHGPLADELELTEEQRQTIHGIVETERQAIEPWHEDLRTLEEAVEDAIEAEPFNEEAVRAAAQQLADVKVEMAVARARVASSIREVLTPEQRDTLAELRAQRHERHRSHHRHDRGT